MDTAKSKEHEKEPEEEAAGSGTRSFFTNVAGGAFQAPDYEKFRPTIYGLTIRAWDAIFEEIGIGPFNRHIYCSIPTYFEYERALAAAVVATFNQDGASLLDIGASEGTFCKVISHASNGKIKTFALDANSAMKTNFETGKMVSGCEFVHASIAPDSSSTPYVDETTGQEVPRYGFDQQFECIVESMFFQFLGVEREAYIKKIKAALFDEGIFICSEKFLSDDGEYYEKNEINKDVYKAFHFSSSEISQKFEEILEGEGVGMGSKQVTYEFMEKLLCKYFRHVIQFWDSGNFKGYACSDGERNLITLIDSLPDLNSEFSTFSTPFSISENH